MKQILTIVTLLVTHSLFSQVDTLRFYISSFKLDSLNSALEARMESLIDSLESNGNDSYFIETPVFESPDSGYYYSLSYMDSTLVAEGLYDGRKSIGRHITYFEDGSIESSVFFDETDSVFSFEYGHSGSRAETWFFYNEDGTIKREEKYEEEKLIEKITYREGVITSKRWYRDGKQVKFKSYK